MKTPRNGDVQIEVLIPAHRDRGLASAAVRSALTQSYSPVRVLIVVETDSESDRALRQLSPSKISELVIFSTNPMNEGQARNFLLANARAEVVAFLDADDTFVPDSLECRARALVSQCETELVAGRAITCLLEAPASLEKLAGEISPPYASASNTLVRRRVFDAIGGFNEGNYAWPEWLARVKAANVPAVFIDNVVSNRGIDGKNLSLGAESRSQRMALLRERSRIHRASSAEG